MIIGTCGFGSTGSSAVSDFLLEFDDIQVLDNIEFDWVSGVDGLIDLDFHVNHPHFRALDSRCAISRYRNRQKALALHYSHSGGIDAKVFEESVDRFLNAITQVSWHAVTPEGGRLHSLIGTLMIKIIMRLEKKLHRQTKIWPYGKACLSIMPNEFEELAKSHVRELLQAMGGNLQKHIVLDQPFAGNNPQASFKFFDDPYAIVVDRDPRDIYVFGKTRLEGRNHFMPMNSVEEFVRYYRLLRDNQPYKESNERILSIRFEDMVYHYEETANKIISFLHLNNSSRPKSVFDPDLSIANTQVWKHYPQYNKDIEYIENELPEFLFDFSDCKEPDTHSSMFFGKSPKHA